MNLITFIILIIILIVCFTSVSSEGFETTDNIVVLLFFSPTCPHCVTFKNKTLQDLSNKLNSNNINVQIVNSDNDPEQLFSKYQVQFVPAAIVVKNNTPKKINSAISYDIIKSTLDSF